MNRERVVCFVDGFNLYHALHPIGQSHLKWLDLRKLFTLLAKPQSQVITQILFFSATLLGNLGHTIGIANMWPPFKLQV